MMKTWCMENVECICLESRSSRGSSQAKANEASGVVADLVSKPKGMTMNHAFYFFFLHNQMNKYNDYIDDDEQLKYIENN